MRRDFDSGKAANPSREARVRRYLKEIQAQNETQASITSKMGQGPAELDASVSLRPTESRFEDRSPDLSNQDDQFPYESAKESLLLCDSLENEQYYQPLPTIDLSRAFDADFSAATARALNDLPSPSNLNLDFDAEAAKTPTPTAVPKSQRDYFVAESSNHVQSPIQPTRPYSESISASAVLETQPDDFIAKNSNHVSLPIQPTRPYSDSVSVPAKPKTQQDYFVAESSSHGPPSIQPFRPYSESVSVSNPSLLNRDSTASADSSQAISDHISLSTGSGDVMSEPREVPTEIVPHVARSPTRSVFSDLDNLVRVSRTRHSDVRMTH